LDRRGIEVTGEWRKLHNEELRDLYPLPSIIRIMRNKCKIVLLGGWGQCKA
jgi:hypothetical protein